MRRSEIVLRSEGPANVYVPGSPRGWDLHDAQ